MLLTLIAQNMDDTFDTGLAELKTVVKYLSDFGVPEENFAIDLTIARGLDYYTGTVYETLITDHPEIGSVCSGGRYDDLAEYYTDKKLPGAGISIGLTRLFYVLNEQGMDIQKRGGPRPFDIFGAALLALAIAAAALLTSRITLYCDDYFYGTFFRGGLRHFWELTRWHYNSFNGRAFVHFLAELTLTCNTKLFTVLNPLMTGLPMMDIKQ